MNPAKRLVLHRRVEAVDATVRDLRKRVCFKIPKPADKTGFLFFILTFGFGFVSDLPLRP